MTKFYSSRLTDDHYVSVVDDAVTMLERAICELLGVDISSGTADVQPIIKRINDLGEVIADVVFAGAGVILTTEEMPPPSVRQKARIYVNQSGVLVVEDVYGNVVNSLNVSSGIGKSWDNSLPAADPEDSGKVLSPDDNGVVRWVAISAAIFPPYTVDDAGKFLRVSQGGTSPSRDVSETQLDWGLPNVNHIEGLPPVTSGSLNEVLTIVEDSATGGKLLAWEPGGGTPGGGDVPDPAPEDIGKVLFVEEDYIGNPFFAWSPRAVPKPTNFDIGKTLTCVAANGDVNDVSWADNSVLPAIGDDDKYKALRTNSNGSPEWKHSVNPMYWIPFVASDFHDFSNVDETYFVPFDESGHHVILEQFCAYDDQGRQIQIGPFSASVLTDRILKIEGSISFLVLSAAMSETYALFNVILSKVGAVGASTLGSYRVVVDPNNLQFINGVITVPIFAVLRATQESASLGFGVMLDDSSAPSSVRITNFYGGVSVTLMDFDSRYQP